MSYLTKSATTATTFAATQLETFAVASLEISELEMLRVTLEKEQGSLLNLGDNIIAQSTIQNILDQYQLKNINLNTIVRQILILAHPPKYESSFDRNNLSPVFSLEPTAKNALHFAAREGNLEEVQNLISAGYDVNAGDIFSTTPLHLAAMYGHENVIIYLLNQGAKINSKAYVSYKYFWSFNSQYAYTPLDLAIKYSPNLVSIEALLKNNAISANWDLLQMDLAQTIENALLTQDYLKLDLALSKIEMLADASNNGLWIDADSAMPMAMFLQLEAQMTTNPTCHQRLIDSIGKLTNADSTETLEHYVRAKNLLQVFPSNSEYHFQVGDFQAVLPASGYLIQPSLNLAAHSLAAYCTMLEANISEFDFQIYNELIQNSSFHLPFESYLALKTDVFNQVGSIFDEASLTIQNAGLREWSEKLYQDYLAGKTILIPTGWMGHGLDIILDKELNLFMVANAGDSHATLSPGLNAYNHKFNLTAEDIYTILNNQDKMSLEFKYFYDLGLVKNEEFSFETDYQLYGNCAWNSQKIAEEALLFLGLKKVTHDHALSRALTDVWFEEFDHFHEMSVLKDYIDKPSLEISALGDIFVNYYGTVETPYEQESAKLIFDALSDPSNIEIFNHYYCQNERYISNSLKSFIIDNGFELTEEGLSRSLNINQENGAALNLEDVIVQPNQDALSLFNDVTMGPSHLDLTSPSLLYSPTSPSLPHEPVCDTTYSY